VWKGLSLSKKRFNEIIDKLVEEQSSGDKK